MCPAGQARDVLSRRGLRPEAFISPGHAKDETLVFIGPNGQLYVRSAAAPPLGSGVTHALAWPGLASGSIGHAAAADRHAACRC